MAARYRWLYPRAIAAARRAGRGSGLWLITNNFSTGGAQSSARRLLLGLQAAGERVRAAVVEEDPEWPTAGRRALVEAKIPVIAPGLNAAGVHEAAIEQILGAVDADPPQSVLFWNLRPAFKVALADALAGVPIYDISPGEMFYDSLEKYFTKPQWKFGCRTPLEYGGLLAGVIVKYSAEAEQAEQFLGAPVHVIPNGVEVVKRNGAGREAEEARPHPSPLPQGEGETSAVPGRMDDSGPRESRCERGQISESPFVFGTAARINPQKRLEDLLEAFHLAHDRLPPYVLKIAGGEETGCGEYAAKLRAGCNGLPVQWLGEVTDVAGFHRGLDAFAMISEPAGCPNASLEAMAAGLPIIATDFGGASEQVIDGETGRLVPARDSRALALALIETATRSELFRKMGMAGKQLMKERFSLERMIEGYRRVCLGGMR
jgi:glycosyltransferase involved in cell wall biosynthesis